MSDIGKKSLELHKTYGGKIATHVKVPLNTNEDLSVAYMPGVADVTMACTYDPQNTYVYTMRQNCVAVITDGSSVLGLGNIGPFGALPVMEGKAMLFKRFVDIDSFPICLATQDPEEIVSLVRNIAPSFAGIHLEDFAAPKCFMIEERLQDLGIPVMHDDQHGTAVVVRAALMNAAKVVGKKLSDLKTVISGGGAAGQATAKLLVGDGSQGEYEHVADVIVVDSKGIISETRDDLDPYKQHIAQITNKEKKEGDLNEALRGADAFVGLSRGNIVNPSMVSLMAKDPIVFGLSNPDPEIMPNKAKEAGARVVATGRSDFPNQVNNALGYPGIFRGALDARAKQISMKMLMAASNALAESVEDLSEENIIPSPFQDGIYQHVAAAVKEAAAS